MKKWIWMKYLHIVVLALPSWYLERILYRLKKSQPVMAYFFRLRFATGNFPNHFCHTSPRYNVFYRVFLPIRACWTGKKLIVCVHIWLVGLAICFFRQTYELHPLPMLGGLLWATGNLCQGLKTFKVIFKMVIFGQNWPISAENESHVPKLVVLSEKMVILDRQK